MFLLHSNDLPLFTGELRALHSAKEEDHRSKTRDLYREAKKKLLSGIKAAKQQYKVRLQQQFSSNDCSFVWKGLKQITNYKPKALRRQMTPHCRIN